jgi:glycosyltransferase involved in cell wall biosynthesis
MKLSIIIPVFNEEKTIAEVIRKVSEIPLLFEREIIVSNDGSTDSTSEKIKSISMRNLKICTLKKNKGKGAAIREALKIVEGDIVIIQDADMEYTPEDYTELIKPIIDGKADVVFGTRLVGSKPHRVLFFWHYVSNKMLTALSNMFTNLNLTDMEVGLKVFKTDIIKNIKLKENRFGFEPEITAKVAKLKCRIYEVPVAYFGRTYEEGKKITWKDGLAALWCIIKYNI